MKMECRVKKDDEKVSHFLKTVVLENWWLIKAVEGGNKRLGVAGYTSKEQAMRAFSSAPIRRTYDVFTLETVDGITVLLKGFINKPRTEENGFPAEVFKHFVFGIPPYWENYVEKFLEGGFGGEDVSRSTKSPEKLVTDSGGSDDFHEGTPNRKRQAVSNSRTTKCDQKYSSEATKLSTNTTRKRIARSSSRLSDANQCLDLNKKQKLASKIRVVNSDDKDLSQAGKDDNNTKKVVLKDWWLIKAIDDDDEGDDKVSRNKRLGVAGYTSKEQVVPAFSSAPIRRTCDVFNLETVDGKTVLLEGLINKPLTEENGFPAEVFKHFVFGFPPYWENYVEKFFEGGSGDEDVSRSTTSPEKLVTESGGPDDFHEGTPNRKRKAISNSRATKCDQKDLSEATKQSTSTNTNTNTNRKRIARSSSKLLNSNQCLDPNKKQKQKLISKTRVANFNDKDSSQATKDDNNTKKVLGNCSRLKKKSTVEEEASSSSKKKTKRKLAYEPSGASSISSQLSSLKKSSSGRKLLPVLEYWRNQTAVYDKEHELTGIKFRPNDLHC